MAAVATPELEDLLAVAPLRRVTLEKYHQMIEAGVLDEDDRVELLHGVIVEMSPQDESHVQPIVRLNAALIRSLDSSFQVRPQVPLTFLPDSEPEPDLAVVRVSDLRKPQHPSTAVLIVEVSLSTLRKDRLVKMPLYARAGVSEYWIVNLKDGVVERHTDPDPAASRYQTLTTLHPGQTLTSPVLPGFSIEVAALFEP